MGLHGLGYITQHGILNATTNLSSSFDILHGSNHSISAGFDQVRWPKTAFEALEVSSSILNVLAEYRSLLLVFDFR